MNAIQNLEFGKLTPHPTYYYYRKSRVTVSRMTSSGEKSSRGPKGVARRDDKSVGAKTIVSGYEPCVIPFRVDGLFQVLTLLFVVKQVLYMSDIILIKRGPTFDTYCELNKLREHDYYVIYRESADHVLYALISRKRGYPICMTGLEIKFPGAEIYPLVTDLISAAEWINRQ